VTRPLHIAGSARLDADSDLLADAHALAANVVGGWLARGGSVVAGIGGEPAHASRPELSVIFDWTVIEAVTAAIREGRTSGRPVLTLRGSRRAYDQVPPARIMLLDELTVAGALDLQLLPDTWRSGALVRRAQAEVGRVLVMLSGGAGVEDLANLYASEGRPVIPIDVDLGASRDDGAQGGGAGLARRAMADPDAFVQMADGSSAGARLAGLAMGLRRPPVTTLADRVLALLDDLQAPRAFCVRLLDPTHSDWAAVEAFFRDVADPVLEEAGLCVVDLGRDPQERSWMNAEIFEQLHTADTVIVDLTAQRPNCYVELGYALARGHRTIITARAGESMPFDTDKLPWHFWDPTADLACARDALREHLRRFGTRAPLVTPARMV
jgi:hypothetical protein